MKKFCVLVLPLKDRIKADTPVSTAYLCGHDALSLRDEGALGADTVSPPAVPLVALQGRHDAVVAAARTLGGALVPLRGPQEEGGWDGSQHGVLRHEGRHVHTTGQAHTAAGA
jgi:hypothetical protein